MCGPPHAVGARLTCTSTVGAGDVPGAGTYGPGRDAEGPTCLDAVTRMRAVRAWCSPCGRPASRAAGRYRQPRPPTVPGRHRNASGEAGFAVGQLHGTQDARSPCPAAPDQVVQPEPAGAG